MDAAQGSPAARPNQPVRLRAPPDLPQPPIRSGLGGGPRLGLLDYLSDRQPSVAGFKSPPNPERQEFGL